jgi:hypothetical protein
MSILITLAGSAGGLAVGTVFGGLVLSPRVGPWRGGPPAASHQAPPQVVVLTGTDPSVLQGLTVPYAATSVPGEVARALGAARAGESR